MSLICPHYRARARDVPYLKEVLEVIALHFLQTHQIGLVRGQFTEDIVAPIVPRERPRRAVRIDLPVGVNIREHIVADDAEGRAGRVGTAVQLR